MGDVSDAILDGTMCQVCGGLMEDMIPKAGVIQTAPGYPRTCDDCIDDTMLCYADHM